MHREQEDGLALWAFDLLYVGGRDIRGLSYIERTLRLAKPIDRTGIPAPRHSEAFADGPPGY